MVAEAVATIRRTRPDVVLLDVHLPDGGGLAVLDACRARGTDHRPAFLALSVIPSLKLTDRGLVDVDRFELVPLAVASTLQRRRSLVGRARRQLGR